MSAEKPLDTAYEFYVEMRDDRSTCREKLGNRSTLEVRETYIRTTQSDRHWKLGTSIEKGISAQYHWRSTFHRISYPGNLGSFLDVRMRSVLAKVPRCGYGLNDLGTILG
jgi:hypothetical protein